MTRPHLLDVLRDKVLLADGAMGTRVQALTLDVEKDYWGNENCTDILVPVPAGLGAGNPSRLLRSWRRHGGDQHVRWLSGDAGGVRLSDRAYEVNKRGAELAREAAESFADGRDRWVLGSSGRARSCQL